MNQGRIQRFLEKTKKKIIKVKQSDETGIPVNDEQEFIRKKVTNLMKRQKHHIVRKMIKGQDDSRPWGKDAQAKVCVIFTDYHDNYYLPLLPFRKFLC